MNDSLLGMFPLLLLIALMIWMLVSQRRRQREVASMQSSLATGDEVVTVGGVIGKIVGDDGPILRLEVSRGVVIRVDRRTVSGRTSDVPALRATGTPVQEGRTDGHDVDPTDPTKGS